MNVELELTDHTAIGLSTKIKQLLKNNNMKYEFRMYFNVMNKSLVGQKLWVVCMMVLKLLYIIIRVQEQPNAIYISNVHCAAHNVNLTINDIAKCSTKVQLFLQLWKTFTHFSGIGSTDGIYNQNLLKNFL